MAGFILSALLVFGLRTTDMTLYTLRILMVSRGLKPFAWLFGFCQSIVFVIALSKVLENMDNWLTIAGYAAGFASGMVVGMFIEDYLGMGYLHIRIVSRSRGQAIAASLRQAGFGVTEIAARGRDGAVDLLHCSVQRRKKTHLECIVKEIDEQAFITSEAIRPVQRGFWGDISSRAAQW
jgi:uncharacterized protein YebE (UPF0316 family)